MGRTEQHWSSWTLHYFATAIRQNNNTQSWETHQANIKILVAIAGTYVYINYLWNPDTLSIHIGQYRRITGHPIYNPYTTRMTGQSQNTAIWHSIDRCAPQVQFFPRMGTGIPGPAPLVPESVNFWLSLATVFVEMSRTSDSELSPVQFVAMYVYSESASEEKILKLLHFVLEVFVISCQVDIMAVVCT